MFLRSFCVATCVLPLLSLLVMAKGEDGYSAKQRINFIRNLGKTDSQAIPTLTPYLNDPSDDIRLEAVKAIVKIGTANSLDPLIKATRDNSSEIQIRATDGIVNFYLPGYVAKGALSGPLTRGVRQVKGYFATRNDQVIALDMTIRPEVASALSDEIIHSASMDARANAARAAGILRDRAALPSLEQALRSKDTELIRESLIALQKIGDPSAGPSVSFLARDLDERVQSTALETIGDLRSLQSAPDVRSAVNNARNAKIRRAALAALAMLGIPGDRALFQRYASDSDPALRASAIEGLGRIREPDDYPVLEAAYNEANADWRVHLAAAFALVNEGKVDTADFSPLRYLMESLDTKAHASVAQAYMTELCRRADVRKALFPIVPQATSDQKIALCDSLAASHDEDVIPVLTALSNDSNTDVALAAGRGLRTVQAHKL
ncbi:MAG: HEAT repeat domain-containing protein [Acidobacteriota bacterium]|nr:HEAT repeat domain-containing protein [Acidobacteriota bacterium]